MITQGLFFIVELDRWTMWEVMKQLQSNNFIEIFAIMLKDTQCNTQWLALEVSEWQIMVMPF